jgi:hypothetical protein
MISYTSQILVSTQNALVRPTSALVLSSMLHAQGGTRW